MYKIYKIDSHIDSDLVYYGKTKQNLPKRFKGHVSNFQAPSQPRYCSSKTLFERYGRENLRITLLEECEDEKRASERERHYITNFPCVNRTLPLRSQHQWFIDNAEYRKAYHKMNDKRREAKRKSKILCECGKEISERHRNEHYKTKSHQLKLRTVQDSTDPNPLPTSSL